MFDRLMCPTCQQPLASEDRCSGCGEAFGKDTGTPILIGKASTRSVPVTLGSSDYGQDLADLDRVLKRPTAPMPSSAKLPYHMDAHQAARLQALPKGSRVLEIGCGGGQNRGFIQSLGHEYVGTDISKTRVFDWLQKHGGPDFLCDAHFLPFQAASFDAVYCTAVFEHLASPPIAAHEIRRVLKPQGIFLGNVSFLEPWHDNSYSHLTVLGVLRLLKGAGFQIDALWPQENYSGFHAMPNMGSRGLKLFKPLGSLMDLAYRAERGLKNMIRGQAKDELASLKHDAVMSGAIFWQAR